MGGAHPSFEGSERVFDGLSSHAHGVGHAVELVLHPVEHVLMRPALDDPPLGRRASGSERTRGAGAQVNRKRPPAQPNVSQLTLRSGMASLRCGETTLGGAGTMQRPKQIATITERRTGGEKAKVLVQNRRAAAPSRATPAFTPGV